MPTSARGVATFEPSAVDELSAQIGVSYEQTEFLFQEYGSEEEQGGQKRPPLGTQGLLQTSNDTFTSLVELVMGGSDAEDTFGDGGGSTGSVSVTRAISTYETNARVISGSNAARGESMSMTL